jgi:hypothetical protein
VFAEPLPSNDSGYAYINTDRWEGFMKYAIEMGSCAMKYIPSFLKIVSVIQKLMGGSKTDSMVIS